MTIQSLFQQADPERVFYGYTLLRPVFDETDNISLEEQTKAFIKLKSVIADTCRKIITCEPDPSVSAKTIFIVNRRGISYDEQNASEVEVYSIDDKDAFAVFRSDFRLWDDEGESRLPFYSIDFTPMKELASYTISDISVNQFGINICCAVILRELLFWGLSEDSREKNQKDLEEKLKPAFDDIQNSRIYDAEDVLTKLKQKYFSYLSDDEKEYERLKDKFEKAAESINERYAEKVMKEDQAAIINIIKKEYSSRNTSNA